MAIDRMKKVTVVCEKSATSRLFKRLHEMSVLEVTNTSRQLNDETGCFRAPEVSTEDCDVPLQKIALALGLLDQFAPEQKSFIQGLAPVPLLVEAAELDKALSGFDLDGVFTEARELDETHRGAEHRRGEIATQLAELAPFERVPFPVAGLRKPERVRLVFGALPAAQLALLGQDARARELMAWEEIPAGPLALELAKNSNSGAKSAPRRMVFAFLPEDAEEAARILAALYFEECALPAITGPVADRIRELREDLAEIEATSSKVREKAAALAVHRRSLQVLKAFWESRKRRLQAQTQSIQGEWVSVVTGFVRMADLPSLESVLAKEFPGASLVAEDPAADDDVPVNLTEGRAAQPLKLLTNMFGLPAYNSFDPSPFMLVNFYVFFGICFSDAAYGIILMAAAHYLAKRTRDYEGVNNFARLLFWAGVSTTFFGFIMGSFFGDLYKASFVPQDNPLARLMSAVTIIDPQEKTMPALLIALVIGIANQFYGIGLKMYGAWKNGDKTTALGDGLTWLIILPGAIILVANYLSSVPGPVVALGAVLFVLGALGLILTQGRDSEGIGAKLGVGVMSIYGIVGSYGLTAFLGDVMSYCRLLALGLTTGILALSFNLIAGLMWDIPVVGPVLTVVLLVLFHAFNFLINVLGAFVHAMRLVFVEWFGRFYESGARQFEPLGFDSPSAIMKKS